ncbi:hypothetical protein Tco_1185989 [Tanacetum coccineum]
MTLNNWHKDLLRLLLETSLWVLKLVLRSRSLEHFLLTGLKRHIVKKGAVMGKARSEVQTIHLTRTLLMEQMKTDCEEIDNTDFTIKKSLSYEKLAYANHVEGSSVGDRLYYQSDNSKFGVVSVPTIDRAERQIPKRSIFPWKKRKLSFRSFKAKGEPLLKRYVREEGGDDIDFDRRMFT